VLFGENCFSMIIRLLSEQKEFEKNFHAKMEQNKAVHKIVDKVIEEIEEILMTEPWYEKLNQSQKYLIEAILAE